MDITLKLMEFILQLDNDAKVQERLGDDQAARLIKDIKYDLEQILKER